MRKNLALLTTAILMVSLLSGCVCETADVVFSEDGSGQISVCFGVSELTAERLDLYEKLSGEGFEAFTYENKTYIGDRVEQDFASAAEFNELLQTLGKRSGAVSDAADIGTLMLSRSGGGLVLTVTCGEKTGSADAMAAALRQSVPNLSEEEAAQLLSDATMTYHVTFPAEVRQIKGSDAGVSVDGTEVSIDLLSCTAGTYCFTTAAEGMVCGRGNDCPLSQFDDTTSDGWYHDGVHYCVENGIMSGTTATGFQPDGIATRGMIFTILARMDGEVITSSGKTWYADGAAWAARSGISDGSDPAGRISRMQLAAMLYRFAGYKGYDTAANADLSAFSDGTAVDDWAVGAMRWAVGSGILTGSNGALRPDAGASRAEVAVMLMRFCTEAV